MCHDIFEQKKLEQPELVIPIKKEKKTKDKKEKLKKQVDDK